MKLTAFLLTIAFLQVHAKGISQVTLSLKEAPVEKVFREIERQTGYGFLYTKGMLANLPQVTIHVRKAPVKEVLNECFKGQSLEYSIDNNTIVITRKVFVAVNTPLNSFYSPPPIEIHGRVVNQQGTPLPNVSVLIVGTNVGTATNSDGRFSLTAPDDKNIVIEVSSVGYQTKKVNVGKQTEVNITLEIEASGLSDVVVIGYGTAKKSDLTGSVAQVSAETFQNQNMTQLTDMLTGTTAGVYTTQATSAAGGGSIEIRGRSSLTAGTDPLIVLDGAIYNGSISDINPNDVESVDILKDASSAAVFGSKAASGVILITTKRGKTGKPIIDFSSKIGVATTTHDLRPLGPKEYLDMHRDYQTEYYPNLPYGYFFNPNDLPDGLTVQEWRNFSANPAASDEDEYIGRIRLRPIEVENYKAGKTTDWYDMVVGPALKQDYSLGVGGGTPVLKYYWSAGYVDNKGIIKGDQFSTVRTRLNLDLKVTNWLNIGTNSQFATRDESVVPTDLNLMSTVSPYGSIWDQDGTLRSRPDDRAINPLENYYGQDKIRKISTLFSILYAQIRFPLGFQYKISFQPHLEFSKDYNFWSSNTYAGSAAHIGGFGTRDDYSSYGWLLDNLLTWNKKVGIHSFDLTLLANAEVSRSWLSHQENSSFTPNENLIYNALQFGAQPGLSNNDEYSSGDALMARLNYTLLNKYLLTASIRRDGYSAFGQQNPRANFPAFAIAWKISDEIFYKISWMEQLKLRLSWGANGNRDIGTYSALAQLGSTLAYNGSNIETGVYNTTLANPGLMWERTNSTNIGLDADMLKGRISLTIDAYDKTTTNLLLNRRLPIITGFTSVISNVGELENRGIEVSINTVNVDNNHFNWRSGLTFSMNRNKIKKLWEDMGDYTLLGKSYSGELPDFVNKWFPGQASDVIWDYDVIGIWQMNEATDATVYKMKPGDYKATDVNDDGKYTQLEDKKFIGYTSPRYRIGFRNEFTLFKNFYASIFIRADLGHLRSMPFLTYNKSEHDRINTWSLPHWSRENPINDYQRNVFPDNVDKYGGGLIIYKPTGFLRVQDVTLSYNFPRNLTQHVKLNNLRVFGAIRNFLTFTNWPGFDPESDMTPMPKVFTLGLNLSL